MDIIQEAKEYLEQHKRSKQSAIDLDGSWDMYDTEVDLISRLVDRLKSQHEDTINEIINKYHKEMIRFYKKEQKTNPNIGNFAHENDIKIHQRMIKALERQEWLLLPPIGDK